MQTQAQMRHDFVGVVAAIRREFEALDRYLAALSAAGWQGATACPDWSVQKTVSHLGSGADLHLRSLRENLAGGEAVTAEIRQKVWGHFDSLPPEPLHAEFRDRNEGYLAYLEGMPAEMRERRVRFFAGETPVVEYAQYRLSELALHSWDIRVALDPTARLLASTVRPHFPHALDTLNRRASASARAEMAGALYGFEVFGPVQERLSVAVRDGTVEVLAGAHGSPAASLRLPAEAFIRLYTGRLPLPAAEAAGEVIIEGDRAAALRLNALFPGY